MKQEQRQQIGLSLLRIALGVLFIAFAIMQLQNPAVWTGFVPEFMASIIDARLLVVFNAAIELVLGAILILGTYTWIVALVLAVHLFIIALSLGLSPTGIRDFGLAFATLSLAFTNPTSRIHEKLSGAGVAMRGALLLGVLILSGIVFAAGTINSRPVEVVESPEPKVEVEEASEEENMVEVMDDMLDDNEEVMDQEMIDADGVDAHSHIEEFPNLVAIERKADAILTKTEQAGGGMHLEFIYHNTYYEADVDADGNTIDIHADEDSH
jgi:uncharacterized membrane protein YphA (DoxX/SURF4 family)